ncbi:MAG: sugar diacid utilization regulator [Synergistales bacterium]|nr:sugar diacid utilization regulator [Synergistales bacterium]
MEIAQSTAEIIGFDVIITDTDGIIVGASDSRRIGELHEASLEVMTDRRGSSTSEEEAKKLKGTLPGVTYPISSISGGVVGSMAITGDADKVRPFALIVKKQIEILLKEREFFERAENREHILQDFIQDLSTFMPGVSNETMLLARASEFRYDRTWIYVPIAIDLYQFGRFAVEIRQRHIQKEGEKPEVIIQNVKRKILLEIRKIFNGPKDISMMESNNRFVVLHAVKPAEPNASSSNCPAEARGKAHNLLEKVMAEGLNAAIGIGSPSLGIANLAEAYKESWRALTLGKKFMQGPGVYCIDDYRLEEMISTLAPSVRNRFILSSLKGLREQPDWEDLKGTIRSWCEGGFSVVNTAKNLHLHRNSVLYRLDKIKNCSGHDLKDFRTCLNLYTALVLDRFLGPGSKE